MNERLKASIRKFPKHLLLAFACVLGCFLAALIAEVVINRYEKETITDSDGSPQAVILLIDCSGSMAHGKLEEVKAAAKRFIRSLDYSHTQVSIIAFSTEPVMLSPLSNDPGVLEGAISKIYLGGSTRLDLAIDKGVSSISKSSSKQNILMFTDGAPDDVELTIAAAKIAKDKNIKLVAICTSDAIVELLEVLTGNPTLVLSTNTGNFGIAFDKAQKIIFGKELIAGKGGSENLSSALLRTCLWTSLISIFLAIFLVSGQRFYMGKPIIAGKELAVAAIGGAIAGALSGTAGQLLYYPLADMGVLSLFGRIAGWILLGAILGFGISYIVPNLGRVKGLLGGLAGGIAGGILFVLFAWIAGDVAARLVGAPALGFCVGLMVVFAEQLARKAWLEVHFAPGESIIVNLGPEPVSIGGGGSCTIYASDTEGVLGEYTFLGGQVTYKDCTRQTNEQVSIGHSHTFGKVNVIVCGVSDSEIVQHDKASQSKNWIILELAGKKIDLKLESIISAGDIPGLEPLSGSGPIAIVVPNPKDASILGLRNLSQRTWNVTLPGENVKTVEAGKAVKLVRGARIDFGLVSGDLK